MPDAEMNAMAALNDVLSDLDEEARVRVLSWASAKFAGATAVVAQLPRTASPTTSAELGFTEVADLVHAAQPDGGVEQALVVGYWLQRIQGHEGWSGAQVNSELTNLGYSQANITVSLTRLMKRKPALVVQTAKAGRSKQARKTYKLSAAGIRAVEDMLAAPSQEV